MKRSLRNLSSNDKEVNSSNFIKLAEYLEQDDEAWIDTIQKLLE